MTSVGSGARSADEIGGSQPGSSGNGFFAAVDPARPDGGNTCPVCGYPGLGEPPGRPLGGESYEICPSCGFQFGVTDVDRGITYEDWRQRWIGRGMLWDSAGIEDPPLGWDPSEQLRRIPLAATEPAKPGIERQDGVALATISMELAWGETDRASVQSVRELDWYLDRLSRQALKGDPFIVQLRNEAGASLSMGLGRPESVVNHRASADPPYYTSVGDPNADGLSVFYYFGQWTELHRKHAIPVEQAREAMRLFVATGLRPDNITWEMD